MTGPTRRRDPQPLGQGWEIAVAVLGGAVFMLVLAALAGLGIASVVFGGGWVWPHSTAAIGPVIAGVLSGHPGRGLNPAQVAALPGPIAIYACVGLCELVTIAASIAVGVLVARYRRPGDARGGMATRREAAQVLGLRELRSARTIIRPDRYPARRNRRK